MNDPLFIDTSSWSPATTAAYGVLASKGPPWHGAIAKCSEGAGRSGQAWEVRLGEWFFRHWPAMADVERYGVDWFRGCYHFLLCDGDGAAQAEHMLRTIELAGGWRRGDLWPVVDIEEGSGNAHRAARGGSALVMDTTQQFADKIKSETGRDVVLYSGWWLKSLGITSHMGCDWLWYARYSEKLPRRVYEAIGWTEDRLLMWQYDGSGTQNGLLENYPRFAPMEHGSSVDINVLTLPGGLDRLRSLLWAEDPSRRMTEV